MNDTIKILLIIIPAALVAVAYVRGRYRHEFQVPEGQAGLLYQHGKYVGTLPAGRHLRWGRHLALTLADLRKTQVTIAGQETLTADNVGLKLSLLISVQVADPARAAHETRNWMGDVYAAGQLALRNAVAGVTAEALLSKRLELGAALLEQLLPAAEKIGVRVHSAEIKDVMFPAELKRAFAEVLKARQEGQAALERARGESAALRNLANAARLLEGNPALLNLRVLQSLASAAGANQTLVMGVPGGFVPLKNGPAQNGGQPAPGE